MVNFAASYNPVPKPAKSRRTSSKQKKLGAISAEVDAELRERSGEKCEVRERCQGRLATERAHTIGRRLIDHKTAVDDLFHVCKWCHLWLDEQEEGIRFKRSVREAGGTGTYLEGRRDHASFQDTICSSL
ncbi:hypothetical protein BBD42_31020 [Paenibacillus sp. BIHB 4019]|uniref:Uncharacterized protein n=1 Tax=Paenibacillus sp. BIHB 4019 TaxID=1870819 RepID=A0A1B2DRV0_9BACL|nr:hypothetical protein [Paenibacillus sp. BIHB 4019]ANY70436.1 hypothetical protein BBD42_31020 [Paenibacillus sp. BIHB 4019]